MRIASSHLIFCLRACCRKSEEVSTSTVCPPCSIRIETRRRLSRGSSETHVSHSQPMEGTPVDVPVPKKVSFISVVSGQWSVVSRNQFLTDHRPLTTDHYYLPPVMSLPENPREGLAGRALETETYCMRRS